MSTERPRMNVLWCVALLAASAAMTAHASATPVVSSVAGDVTHGSALAISGSNFGTKAQAAPFKYDDFESGVLDERVQNGWYTSSSTTDCWPIYSSAHARAIETAERSAYLQHDKAYNSTLGVTGLNWDYGQDAYLSCWYYCTTTGAGSRNFKILAFRGGGAGDWAGPDFRADMYPANGGGHAYVSRPDKSLIIDDWSLGGNLQENGWRRIELYMHTGTAGSGDNDGVCLGWRNLSPWWSLTNFEFDFSTQNYDNIYFAAYFARDTGAPTPCMWWYWDEIYIDTTQARVELGNAATWSGCTHREVQIPTTWSAGSIGVTVNQGTFIAGQQAYIYVVDADGSRNSSGYPVTIGGTAYSLTVNSGDGDGQYPPAHVVAIQADAAPSGCVFDAWTGDTAGIADAGSPETTITMPAADTEITAAYRLAETYTLTVNSGAGGGTYLEGEVVGISADAAGSGKTFDEWVGDITGIADVGQADTALTMPAQNAEVTATYRNVGVSGTVHFREGGGAAYTDVTFDDAYLYVDPPSDLPHGDNTYDGIQVSSAKVTLIAIKDLFTEVPASVGGGPINIMSATLHLFRYNSGTSSTVVSVYPVITDWLPDAAGANENDVSGEHSEITTATPWAGGSWSSSDYDGAVCSTGYWVDGYDEESELDVTAVILQIYADQTNYGVVLYASGSINGRASEYGTLARRPSLEITYEYPPTEYALTVNSGAGDGQYAEGETAAISADAPASGYTFGEWVGDTAGIADASATDTTLTMPPADAEVTATYVEALKGDLDGSGFVGQDDLDIVLDNWGLSVPPADPRADPSGDNFVGQADLDIVLDDWGEPSQP